MIVETQKDYNPSGVRTEEMVLNMGPQHPSTHGVLRLELTLEGEIIKDVRPHIGYLHRCFEKHAEAMTYPQVVPYTDRMDYLASMYNEFGYAVAVEKLLGIEVPERVEYIRVIMGEFQRIASHLVALGTYGADIGAGVRRSVTRRAGRFCDTGSSKASTVFPDTLFGLLLPTRHNRSGATGYTW